MTPTVSQLEIGYRARDASKSIRGLFCKSIPAESSIQTKNTRIRVCFLLCYNLLDVRTNIQSKECIYSTSRLTVTLGFFGHLSYGNEYGYGGQHD